MANHSSIQRHLREDNCCHAGERVYPVTESQHLGHPPFFGTHLQDSTPAPPGLFFTASIKFLLSPLWLSVDSECSIIAAKSRRRSSSGSAMNWPFFSPSTFHGHLGGGVSSIAQLLCYSQSHYTNVACSSCNVCVGWWLIEGEALLNDFFFAQVICWSDVTVSCTSHIAVHLSGVKWNRRWHTHTGASMMWFCWFAWLMTLM